MENPGIDEKMTFMDSSIMKERLNVTLRVLPDAAIVEQLPN